MKLIIGLGNYGDEYKYTRHNVGFLCIDWLLYNFPIIKKINKFDGELLFSKVNNEDLIFLKPLTYMNNSGICIKKVMDFYKIHIDNILVIYDDLDSDFVSCKWKNNGSSGGHNGIKSIISHLKTENFKRLKIGISRPENKNYKIDKWVLSNFNKSEIELLELCFKNQKQGIENFIKDIEFDKIKSKFNKK